MYHFYILFSEKRNRYYIGHTGNLMERLKKHNTNHNGFTWKTGDWQIVYSEEFTSNQKRMPVNVRWKNGRAKKPLNGLSNQPKN